ncbi:MAG: PQQ-binding-like beta-propeller repeat protein [Candidatus Sabulitectum sp.]|nr:PQQ-binding-like beta-propeller repeat protein [Candidatus Sabulitectum sp.]
MGIDELSGETIWQVKISYGTMLSATPAFHDDRLYFADMENEFYALSADDGKDIWSTPGTQSGSPGIADGIVFYGERFNSYKARVNALDCQDGSVVWFYETSGQYIQSSPAITDGIVYIAGTDGDLFAFGTGLKFTYLDDLFAEVGTNELIVTSFYGGAAAADTISFTVTGTGINLLPSQVFNLSVSPNPFSSSASVSFDLSIPGETTVKVFDLSGREVSVLVNSEMTTGKHTVQWDGSDQDGHPVSAGLYLCRIESQRVIETIGLCLLK